ncbi:MAG: Glu/Leu/Phe/Val dehydrogenase [bacterium]|nr:Glu/Leu/Phe/Val dehydrogenase [bacterium]
MSTFFEDTQKFVKEAVEAAHIPGDILAKLEKPDKVLEFEIPVKMDDGSEKKFQAWRVQHNNALGPYKGGIRFHPQANLDEVKALAFLMTLKTSLAGIPYGGAKGAVRVNPGALSVREVEELSRGYVRALWQEIGPDKDIPAPDVGTNAQIIDWMADEYEKLLGHPAPGTFTGKSLAHGGSQGREPATGFGGFVVLREFLNLGSTNYQLPTTGLTVAVQGIGNVGSFFARSLLRDTRMKLVAVSNSKGGVYREGGINIGAAMKNPKDLSAIEGSRITNEELLGLSVDVLALAALENSVTEQNAGSVEVGIILELANGPVSYGADVFLAQKKVHVVPDILANSGGVVGSYFEWVQNRAGESWSEEEVLGKIETVLEEASKKVLGYAREKNISLRYAAYALALERVAGAMKNAAQSGVENI